MKIWKMGMLAITMEILFVFPSFAGNWNYDSSGWWYRMENGSYPKDTWQAIDDKWYFFDTNGYMKIGWIQSENNWYYCMPNGSLATDRWIDGTYYVGADGAMYVNTTTPDGKKVNATGQLIVEQKKDYSAYVGEYTELEDYANEHQYVGIGGMQYLTITAIQDNKIYGNGFSGAMDFYEEKFDTGVELENDSFVVIGYYYDYRSAFSKGIEEPEGVPYSAKYTLSKKNGQDVIIKDDGTILYKINE